MYRLIVIPALFLFSLSIKAQGIILPGGAVGVSNASSPHMYLRELFSQPLNPQKTAGITGSPFVYDDWMLARLKFFDDRTADSIYVRINAYENKVHFKDDRNEELQVSIVVKEITITDSNPNWHGVVFRSGYKGGGNAFFQVLEDGKKMQLLKKMMVTKWETKALGEEDKKSFQLESEIYFAGNGEVYKQNKKCNALSEAFETKQQQILDFVNTNAIRCNKEDDMRKLVVYFNTL